MLIEILIFLLTFLIAYVFYAHRNVHKYFDKYGVKYLPGYPGLGNAARSTFGRKHVIEDIGEIYDAFPGERYVGYIEGMRPILIIKDPELIRRIAVRDYEHFMDHKQFFPEDIEPLIGKSLPMLKGDKWRAMRLTLSPAFTGSKMRHMMPFMTEISNNIINYLKENYKPNEDLDVGDVVRRYTNDVIASTGFGLQINSLKDKDNEFYKTGQDMFSFSTWQRVSFLFAASYTNLVKATTKFFRDLVKSSIEYRMKSDIVRQDMIQLLIEASKGNLKHDSNEDNGNVGFATVDEELKPKDHTVTNWSIEELSGQVLFFFMAGFESAAAAVIMAIHELALNPEIQEKLYQEIKTFKVVKKELTFDNVNALKYLDCVLNETSRKWSPALIMDRVCTKPYVLPPAHEGGNPLPLKPGDVVYNVINPIHMDPEYYPDPHKFEPERFSDENKHKIQPFTFMPFGVGPRNCIASRFVILEVKILLYNLLLNFKFHKGPKTSDPIILDSNNFNINAKGGTYVRLELRK